MFKFIHATDIHLDSPLRGLERYEGAPVERVRQAARRALENLIGLAVEEEVQFICIAGDLYDGDWKDYNTGLFFCRQMSKLREAGIRVFLITGNHDAMNLMTRSLQLPDNVKMLSTRKPETVKLDDVGVAIHGQGFSKREVKDDLSEKYPSALSGYFNIGMLHTSATGREGHDVYAPCTVDGLLSKGFQYWALGHVHTREVLHKDPPILFSGNIQGRHIRETGPKGCTLVTVSDDHKVEYEHRDLDTLRWERMILHTSGEETGEGILDLIEDRINDFLGESDGRPIAMRVEINGPCPAHEQFAIAREKWVNEIRRLAAAVSGESIWIEKVKINTSPVINLAESIDREGPLNDLLQYLDDLETNEEALIELSGELDDLIKKIPHELKEEPDALDLKHPDYLRNVLSNVKETLVARFHEMGERYENS